MGKLYIVGTPIGNLGDLSPRAAKVLGEVDFIAAEDTRVSRKLLSHLGLHKPMVSYYEHNLRERGEEILSRLQAGESCAIVTDAGMPCISDPGEDLVRLCAERGIGMEVVPGPSAVIAALAVSGLPTGRFSFEGFLSVKRSSRMAHLEEIKNDRRTLIFYEAPHKLCDTLDDLAGALGPRQVSVAKELTKVHETVLRTTLDEAARYYREHPPKGEYVLVIEGAKPAKEEEGALSFEEAVAMVRKLSALGKAMSEACREVASLSGHKKGELYKAALQTEE